MRRLTPLTAVAVLVLATASACSDGGDSTPRHLRAAPPETAALEDLLPAAAAPATPPYAPASRFALRRSDSSGELLGFIGHAPAAVLLDDGRDENAWSFGTGEDGLRAVFGNEAVDAGAARLADAYRGFLDGPALRAAIAELVAGHPTLSALDLEDAWDAAGLRIESMSLLDGMWVDADGDGALETARSMLMVQMTLPSFPVPTPANPFPACAALIGDGSVPAAYAEENGRTWVAPSEASWRWRLTLTAHVALEDLAPVHDALWDPTDYLSQGERDAASHDLGLFAGFLADPVAGLRGSDLVVSLEPDPELAEGTLHVVSAMARTAEDAACLREVDGWLAEVALIQPSLSEEQLSGAAPEGHLLHGYPALLAAAEGVDDPGLSCLHDADGNPLMIASEPACATASGPVELLELGAAGSAMLVTPAMRLSASLPRPAALGGFEIAPCTENPWKSLCTDRFGRGIRLCLGEWAIRNQVGDYWNIHWWQSPGKAGTQVAIKAGAYVLKGVAYVFLGSGETKFLVKLAAVSEGSSYIADLVNNLTNTKVAGTSIKGVGVALHKVLLLTYKAMDVVKKEPSLIASFTVDRVIDGLAQMAEVEAVGWQDFSSDSHCRCQFQYRHPNYCD